MGEWKEFKLPVRMFLKAYPWRRIDPVPWARLDKALAQSRVALVSSAGLVPPDQEPFDDKMRGGDPSYRWVAADTPAASLVDCHRSDVFDHAGIQADPNLAMPLQRMSELASDGFIGEQAPRHLSFMGSQTAPGRLIKRTAPEAAAGLVADGVEAALLVPV